MYCKRTFVTLCATIFAFCCSDNFLTVEIFYGTLMTEETSQMKAYDGFAFFCKFVRSLM